jgi:hypothetical protein
MPLRNPIRRSVQSGGRSDASDPSDTRCGRLLESAATVERELWFLVVCLMLIDVTLTVHGRNLGLVEQNPIARQAIEAAGVFGLYGLKAAALGLGLCCRFAVHDRYGPVVPFGLAVPSLAAVSINTVLVAVVGG